MLMTADGTAVEAGDPITLRGIDLGVGSSVTVTISRTMLTGRAADTTVTPAITELAAIAVGTYDWGTTLRLDTQTSGGEGLADPKLYVVGDDRSRVMLGIITIPVADTANPDDATPNTLTNYHAASKQNIRFQFVQRLPPLRMDMLRLPSRAGTVGRQPSPHGCSGQGYGEVGWLGCHCHCRDFDHT